MERIDITMDMGQRDLAQISLHAGDKLMITSSSDLSTAQVLTAGGLSLGSLTDEQSAILAGQHDKYAGHIRTVKRDPGTGKICYLEIRFCRAALDDSRRYHIGEETVILVLFSLFSFIDLVCSEES